MYKSMLYALSDNPFMAALFRQDRHILGNYVRKPDNFFKRFQDPIETVVIPSAQLSISYANAKEAVNVEQAFQVIARNALKQEAEDVAPSSFLHMEWEDAPWVKMCKLSNEWAWEPPTMEEKTKKMDELFATAVDEGAAYMKQENFPGALNSQ